MAIDRVPLLRPGEFCSATDQGPSMPLFPNYDYFIPFFLFSFSSLSADSPTPLEAFVNAIDGIHTINKISSYIGAQSSHAI